MQTILGNWPGNAGGNIDTITLNPKLLMWDTALSIRILSCCPRSLRFRVYAANNEGSTTNTDPFSSVGSNTRMYSAMDKSYRPSSLVLFGVSEIAIEQITAGCAGEPFRMKFCLTTCDSSACTGPSQIFSKSCGGVDVSYVDIV